MDCGVAWLALMCVQIVTEVFPVSSSGHQWLLGQWFGVQLPDTLDHLANGLCSLLVAVYFLRRTWHILRNNSAPNIFAQNAIVLGFVADSVTLIFYITRAYGLIAIPHRSIGFAITAVLLLCVQYRGARIMLTYRDAIILGCAQGVALIMGCSRLGTTLWCATAMGLRADAAWYWSWWLYCGLSIPAAVVAGMRLMQQGGLCLLTPLSIAALACAIVLALFGMWFMEYCVTRHTLSIFSWYLMVPFILAMLFGPVISLHASEVPPSESANERIYSMEMVRTPAEVPRLNAQESYSGRNLDRLKERIERFDRPYKFLENGVFIHGPWSQRQLIAWLLKQRYEIFGGFSTKPALKLHTTLDMKSNRVVHMVVEPQAILCCVWPTFSHVLLAGKIKKPVGIMWCGARTNDQSLIEGLCVDLEIPFSVAVRMAQEGARIAQKVSSYKYSRDSITEYFTVE